APLADVRKQWDPSGTSQPSWPEQPRHWAGTLARGRSKGQRLLRAAIARCVFGNPFRRLPALPASLLTWHDGLVPKLAQAAYEHRLLPSGHLDPQRISILCDGLEDAGCAEAELLGHLRGEGPHWRGCHVVDLVLKKD